MSNEIYAFTDKEEERVAERLENLVRVLRSVPGGGKFEEDYWSYIYHEVKGAPTSGWSNLPMRDYMYKGLGVEMKLLRRNSPLDSQGKKLMHPSATRAIAFDPTKSSETCKEEILNQFGQQISQFRERVRLDFPEVLPEIRWGIFLWSPDLDEFLYFEEVMKEPDPDLYRAEFVDRKHRGKPTRSLWIYEKESGEKRYSVTMPDKGAKVQPYFDVPKVGEGAYSFTIPANRRRMVWLREESVEYLESISGTKTIDDYLKGLLDKED